MNGTLEYRRTVRAISDRMEADIYQIKGSKCYMVVFSSISLSGKKQLLSKKVMAAQHRDNYTALKHGIREKVVLETFN